MLIGSGGTGTTVKVNRLRLVCSPHVQPTLRK